MQAVVDVLEDVRPARAGQGEPVHLFGNSLGGLVSVGVAARRPDLVATLTLISPAMPVYRVPAGVRPGHRAGHAARGPGARPAADGRAHPGAAGPRRWSRRASATHAGPAERFDEAVEELREYDAQPWAGQALTRSSAP